MTMYHLKCRMGVDSEWFHFDYGYSTDIEIRERAKLRTKTWRHITIVTYMTGKSITEEVYTG